MAEPSLIKHAMLDAFLIPHPNHPRLLLGLPVEVAHNILEGAGLPAQLNLHICNRALRAWVKRVQGDVLARGMCANRGCVLGPEPYPSLEGLRNDLNEWTRKRYVRPRGYEEVLAFKSAGTSHLVHDAGMLVCMQPDGEATVALAPATMRGRTELMSWRWKDVHSLPLATTGNRRVDRILLSGNGFAVFVVLEALHEPARRGAAPHR